MVKHLAVSLIKENGKLRAIQDLQKLILKRNIPLLTVYILEKGQHSQQELQELRQLLQDLPLDWYHEHKVKISFIGKWYLPDVEPMKQMMEATKDYDSFFVNFCINYDGRQEIVDACKLIAMQAKSDKIMIDSIDESMIKDQLAMSYFLPPDLIVFTGKMNSFLLWDSCYASILFYNKELSGLSAWLEGVLDTFL